MATFLRVMGWVGIVIGTLGVLFGAFAIGHWGTGPMSDSEIANIRAEAKQAGADEAKTACEAKAETAATAAETLATTTCDLRVAKAVKAIDSADINAAATAAADKARLEAEAACSLAKSTMVDATECDARVDARIAPQERDDAVAALAACETAKAALISPQERDDAVAAATAACPKVAPAPAPAPPGVPPSVQVKFVKGTLPSHGFTCFGCRGATGDVAVIGPPSAYQVSDKGTFYMCPDVSDLVSAGDERLVACNLQ